MLLAFALSAGTSARAQESSPARAPEGALGPIRASLTWRRGVGADHCISSEQLEKALEAHLGAPVFEEDGELVVEGAVTREESPARFRAQVELRDRQGSVLGRREVEVRGDACGGLDEALVLVLALAIDTQLAVLSAQATSVEKAPVSEPTAHEAEPTPSAPAQPAPVAPKAAPAPSPEPAPSEAPPRHSSGAKIVRLKGAGSAFGLVLAVGSGLAVGIMPATAWDLSLTMGWRTPSDFGIELSGTFLPFGRVPTSEGRLDFRAGVAELRGCAPFVRGPVLFDGCVGLWNGVMRARASGFSVENTTRTSPLSGATVQARAAWEFYGRYFLRAAAGLGIPFVRDRFTVVGSEGSRVDLHRMSPAIALLGLDLGIQLR